MSDSGLSSPDHSAKTLMELSLPCHSAGRSGLEEFCSRRIPGAAFFDVDMVADLSTNLPHMLPSESAFAAAADACGITKDCTVVVYDGLGIFSAPRVWWTFRVFGHNRLVLKHNIQLTVVPCLIACQGEW